MKYWLMKNEPSVYSIDDLQRDRTYRWDGVRNYQARNFIRDSMRKGDLMLYYHSNADPNAIVGVREIISDPYPDPTQFDNTSVYFDPKATKREPRWFAVDVRFVSKCKDPVSLRELKGSHFYDDMLVVQKGMRLSVQPVLKKHFNRIIKAAATK